MPQLGETVAEGKISKWFVSAGSSVKPGDNLFEIETDKVSMEVPAIAAGTLAAIHVQAGEVAPVGAVVAVIERAGETVSVEKPAAPAPAKAPPPPAKQSAQPVAAIAAAAAPRAAVPMEPFREVRSPDRNYGPARLPGSTTVTPLARRLAGEAGIDLTRIKGSGPHGRIVAADIASAKPAKGSSPALAPATAQIVLAAEIELTQALALCAEVEAIALADVVIKAWALTLQRVQAISGGIAVAVGKDHSVVHDAATKSLTAIAAARSDGAADDATSAISIPDVAGITSIAGALQPDQTTLLSIAAPRRAPVEAADGAVKFVSVMTATLSCAPRAVDATTGAALLAAFKGFVEKPVTMLV